jgi:hypothetical protein
MLCVWWGRSGHGILQPGWKGSHLILANFGSQKHGSPSRVFSALVSRSPTTVSDKGVVARSMRNGVTTRITPQTTREPREQRRQPTKIYIRYRGQRPCALRTAPRRAAVSSRLQVYARSIARGRATECATSCKRGDSSARRRGNDGRYAGVNPTRAQNCADCSLSPSGSSVRSFPPTAIPRRGSSVPRQPRPPRSRRRRAARARRVFPTRRPAG